MAEELGGWGGGGLPGPWGTVKGARMSEKGLLLEKVLCKDQFGEIEARAAFLATSSQENQIQVSLLSKQHCDLAT